ncbi:MAG: hypothetical protein CMH49_10260 [Myxococcales bacterium]|nr:hypothetical protein [Myxococcales bacterium]
MFTLNYRQLAKFNSYDHRGKRALILALTWTLYSLGSYLDLSVCLGVNLQGFVIDQVKWWQLGIKTGCLVTVLSLLYLYSKSKLTLLAICMAPSLVICTLAGSMLKHLNEQEHEIIKDLQSIELLEQSQKVFGQATLLDYRQSRQSCFYTFIIHEVHEPRQMNFDSDQTQVARTWQKSCKAGLQVHSTVWFKGKFTWILGRSAEHLRQYKEILRRKGIAWSFKGELLLKQERQSQSLHQMFRNSMETTFKKAQNSKEKERTQGIALLKGIILGDSGAMDLELLKKIRTLGLGHLLAVSGLHVGVCALLFAWLFRRISQFFGAQLPILWSLATMICVAWFYVALANAPISAKRAALMITFWGIGQISFWPLSPLESLWLSAWSLTINQVGLCQEMGLQLSLFATLGLHTCLSEFQINRRYVRLKTQSDPKYFVLLRPIFQFLQTSLKVSWVSWSFTLPIFVWHLGVINISSIPFNTLITPLVSIFFIPAVLLASVCSPLWDWPLIKCIDIAQDLADLVLAIEVPLWFELRVYSLYALPLLLLLLAYYCRYYAKEFYPLHWTKRLLLDERLVTYGLPIKIEQRVGLVEFYQKLTFILLCLALGFAVLIYQEQAEAQVSFLYVGQGDATLIKNHRGEYALFDVGPPSSARTLIRTLKRRGVYRIRWIAISHLHPDHYGALGDLVKEFKVDMVIYHGRDQDPIDTPHKRSELSLNKIRPRLTDLSKIQLRSAGVDRKKKLAHTSWREVRAQLDKQQIPLITTQVFQKSITDHHEWGGLQLTWVLGSFTEETQSVFSENDASLALLVAGKYERILLSGDLEIKGELRLQKRWNKVDMANRYLSIWQANHHGSRTSSSASLIDTLKPRELVYSLDGLHKFAFPHPEVVKRFTERGIRQIRLDLHGDYNLKL